MADVRVGWVLPTTRKSGKPLNPADIASVRIELSADNGATFIPLNDYPPSVLETVVADLDFGQWVFKGTVFDTAGRASDAVISSIVIADTTPPGPLTLTLTLL